jgi:TM2 domain-containing membrane protein YozV
MNSTDYTIFEFVVVILAVVALYWLYLDNAEITKQASAQTYNKKKSSGSNGVVSAPQNNQVLKERKSTGIAAVLSFFYPGLGQIYNGQILKGFLFLAIQTILIFIAIFIIFFGGFAVLFGIATGIQGGILAGYGLFVTIGVVPSLVSDMQLYKF